MRKDLIVRQTAIAHAMTEAAATLLSQGGTLPPVVSNYVPRRAVKREPTWTVSRRQKGN